MTALAVILGTTFATLPLDGVLATME